MDHYSSLMTPWNSERAMEIFGGYSRKDCFHEAFASDLSALQVMQVNGVADAWAKQLDT